jgi:hypothetical protein
LFAAASIDPDARGTACDSSLRARDPLTAEPASFARRELPTRSPPFAPGWLPAVELPLDGRETAGWLPDEDEGGALGAVCCRCDALLLLLL